MAYTMVAEVQRDSTLRKNQYLRCVVLVIYEIQNLLTYFLIPLVFTSSVKVCEF